MRKSFFDVLKGFAIIAVVLYHMGICTYGYLGVDIFFVIAGYFTIKSLKKIENYDWSSYIHFLRLRLLRLLPLLIVACIACVLWGLYFMLPDDYENLSESVIATSFFSNNILSCITTSNYWDVVNEYKPLMHTWYVGVLMQYYVVFALVFVIVCKICKHNAKKIFPKVLIVAVLISFFLFVIQDNDAKRFYYIQYRFFEFCIGAIILLFTEYFAYDKIKTRIPSTVSIALYIFLFLLVFVNKEWSLSSQLRLVTVCIVTGALLLLLPNSKSYGFILENKLLATVGACSYSIFVWHQIILAFIRYSFTDDLFNVYVLISYILLLCLLTVFSYKFIERLPDKKNVYFIGGFAFIIVNVFSLYIYANAGVTRDVPELGVYVGQQKRGMHAEYNDRGYEFDCDFENDETKEKWLVIGNSFGRDLVNIILESPIRDSVDISYMEDVFLNNQEISNSKAIERINASDVVFYSTKGVNEDKIEFLKRNYMTDGKQLYIVGEKNFGKSNGIIYRHRNDPDYHSMTISMEEGYEQRNTCLQKKYGESFINMISYVQQPDGKVRVFNDHNLFISQDCRHLTQGGAQFYSDRLNLRGFLQKTQK